MATNQWSWVTTVPTEFSHLVSVLNKRLKALEGKLRLDDNLRESVISKTAAYTATDRDHVILCDASSGAFTVTLPASIGGKEYYVKKTDSSGNAVTVDGNASETIDNDTTVKITRRHEALLFWADGSNWHIL